METGEKKKRRRLWLLIPLLLAVGAVVLFALLGRSGLSVRFDDPQAILADYSRTGWASVTPREDGAALLRLEKEDLYYLARRGVLSLPWREQLSGDGQDISFGFRLSGDRVIFSLYRRELGILPVTYRCTLAPHRVGTRLVLRCESVILGTRLRLPEKRWPEVLRQDFVLDFSALPVAEELLDFRLEDSGVILELSGLRAVDGRALRSDTALLLAMDFLGPPRAQASLYNVLRTQGDAFFADGGFRKEVLASDNPADTLAAWMAWCTPASLSSLWEGHSDVTRDALWKPVLAEAENRRAALAEELRAQQGSYERLLFTVREMYRSGALRIGENGFYNTDKEKVTPDVLSRLNISATDSRFVFLFDSADSGEISREDMPTLEDVPWVDWRTAMLADLPLQPDLGVVLTTEGGVPVLLHRRSDGTLVFREITEDRFVSVLVAQGIPRLDMAELPEGGEEFPRAAGEGWAGAVLLPLKSDAP